MSSLNLSYRMRGIARIITEARIHSKIYLTEDLEYAGNREISVRR